jgi:hypothetical protein
VLRYLLDFTNAHLIGLIFLILGLLLGSIVALSFGLDNIGTSGGGGISCMNMRHPALYNTPS